jgi:HAD-superfamily hydrolase, subfamily IIB
MKDIRLIATDIDGTLLNSGKHISPRTLEALREAHNQGVRIALCSGRGRSAMTYIEEELGIPVIYSCFNGGYVEIDGETVEKHVIKRDRLEEAYKVLDSFPVSKTLFSLDSWYKEKKDIYYQQLVKNSRHRGTVTPFPALFDILEAEGTEVFKIIGVSINTKVISAIEKEFRCLDRPGLSVVLSDPKCVEVMMEGADKANTLGVAERVLGIKKENIVAFGDYDNDLNMLRNAGYGVAMGNAPERVKNAASFVTLDNNSDGIGVFLEKLLHDQKNA